MKNIIKQRSIKNSSKDKPSPLLMLSTYLSIGLCIRSGETFQLCYKYDPHRKLVYNRLYYPKSYIKVFRKFKIIKHISDYRELGRIKPLSKLARRNISIQRRSIYEKYN